MSDLAVYLRDPLEFYRREIVLDNGARFGDVARDWQLELLREMESGARRYLWFECPRGYAKTTLLAMVAVKHLLLGRPGARIYSAAGDQEQARFVADEANAMLLRNPKIGAGINPSRSWILNPARGSSYWALSADARTSWGLKPDVVLIDELSVWRGRELFDSLMSATGKIPTARLFVATNAGFPATWQAEVREVARTSDSWHFHAAGSAADGGAPWITGEWIEDQRRMLPPSVFARVIENRWVSGEGEFVTPAQVDAVTDPEHAEVTSAPERKDGRRRYVGLDLGLTRDMAACATVHLDEDGVIVLDRLKVWAGSRGNPVQFAAVEEELDLVREFFGSAGIVADQWNLEKLRQDRRDLAIEPVTFGQKYYVDVSQALFRAIANRRLRLYPDAGLTWREGIRHTLQGQLVQLQVIENEFGFRFDHRTGGFSDMAVAIGMAVHRATRATVLRGPQKALLGTERRVFSGFSDYLPSDQAARAEEDRRRERSHRGAVLGRRRRLSF